MNARRFRLYALIPALLLAAFGSGAAPAQDVSQAAPVVEAPVVEAPAVEAPVVDVPAAGGPKPVASFKAWQALTYQDKDLLMCYTISRPGVKLGDLAGRGDAAALVTRVANREANGGRDEVSVVLGFEPKKGNPVLVKIGKKTFRLTRLAEGRAWAKDDSQDRQMVEAMKHADWLVVNATSAAKGNVKTQDTYALAGFAKAYAAMTEACR